MTCVDIICQTLVTSNCESFSLSLSSHLVIIFCLYKDQIHLWNCLIFPKKEQVGILIDILFLQFYLEEVKGRVDYQGYIYPRRRGQVVSDPISFLILIHF